jgi:cytochrome c oxidase subunit 4
MTDERAHAGASDRALVGLWLTLLALTAVTVVVSRMRLDPWSVIAALGIAAAKASLVLAFFMRLKDEDRAFMVMFGLALFTMATILALVFVDVAFR